MLTTQTSTVFLIFYVLLGCWQTPAALEEDGQVGGPGSAEAKGGAPESPGGQVPQVLRYRRVNSPESDRLSGAGGAADAYAGR